jgi:hypothetical protein
MAEDTGHAGIDFKLNGISSQDVTGNFLITTAVFDYSGSTVQVTDFYATFSHFVAGVNLDGFVEIHALPDGYFDVILEEVNEGMDSVESSTTYDLAENVENLTLTGLGNINGTGNELNNALTGNSGNNLLDGGAGLDVAVYGGLYRQYLVTGDAVTSATVKGPQGADSLTDIEKLQFVDGSLNFDAFANIWRADRLYEATLDRHGDPVGLNNWSAQLDAGVQLSTVAIGFTNSAEFQNTYGSLDNSQFVNQLYLNVLDRPADPGGLANWVSFLNSGWTRGQVVVGFSESQEFVNNHASQIAAGHWDIDETAASVARLYWGTLDRAPEVGGLTNWVNFLKSGQYTLPQAAEGFTGSAEFQITYGALNNTDFVNQLYLNVLDRPADPDGLANWTGFLAAGMTRGQVALGFTESAEFQIKMIGQIDGGIHAVDALYFEPPPGPG